GHLALESAQPLVVETKLESASLLQLGVFAGPHFAKTASAQLLDQLPAWTTGDFQPEPRPPAQRFLLAGTNCAPGLLVIRSRSQRSKSFRAHLEDLQRFVAAFEQVRPVCQPAQNRSAPVPGRSDSRPRTVSRRLHSPVAIGHCCARGRALSGGRMLAQKMP